MGGMGSDIIPINLIPPMALKFLALRLLIAMIQPGFRHPLTQAAVFDEFFLQRLQLLVQQIIGLVNQTDSNIGDHIRRSSLDELPV